MITPTRTIEPIQYSTNHRTFDKRLYFYDIDHLEIKGILVKNLFIEFEGYNPTIPFIIREFDSKLKPNIKNIKTVLNFIKDFELKHSGFVMSYVKDIDEYTLYELDNNDEVQCSIKDSDEIEKMLIKLQGLRDSDKKGKKRENTNERDEFDIKFYRDVLIEFKRSPRIQSFQKECLQNLCEILNIPGYLVVYRDKQLIETIYEPNGISELELKNLKKHIMNTLKGILN